MKLTRKRALLKEIEMYKWIAENTLKTRLFLGPRSYFEAHPKAKKRMYKKCFTDFGGFSFLCVYDGEHGGHDPDFRCYKCPCKRYRREKTLCKYGCETLPIKGNRKRALYANSFEDASKYALEYVELLKEELKNVW